MKTLTPNTSLRRAITGPMLFLFILGDVLGAGVYALAGTIAGEVGGAIWVPLLIALFFAMLKRLPNTSCTCPFWCGVSV